MVPAGKDKREGSFVMKLSFRPGQTFTHIERESGRINALSKYQIILS